MNHRIDLTRLKNHRLRVFPNSFIHICHICYICHIPNNIPNIILRIWQYMCKDISHLTRVAAILRIKCFRATNQHEHLIQRSLNFDELDQCNFFLIRMWNMLAGACQHASMLLGIDCIHVKHHLSFDTSGSYHEEHELPIGRSLNFDELDQCKFF